MRSILFVTLTMLVGCTAPAASTECIGAWETGVDEGEACEASVAALAGETGETASETERSTTTTTTTARDVNTGLANGRRTHKPWVF